MEVSSLVLLLQEETLLDRDLIKQLQADALRFAVV